MDALFSKQNQNVAHANRNLSAPKQPHAATAENNRFGKLRTANQYDERVIEVVPSHPTDRAALHAHFPNAARKLEEYHGQPLPQQGFFERVKETIAGIRGHGHDAVDRSDPVNWRRAHVAKEALERNAKADARRAAILKGRQEKLHVENAAVFKKDARKSDARRSQLEAKRVADAGKRHEEFLDRRTQKIQSSEARHERLAESLLLAQEQSLKSRKASIMMHNDQAAMRHDQMMKNRSEKLREHDKVRSLKAKKALADRNAKKL